MAINDLEQAAIAPPSTLRIEYARLVPDTGAPRAAELERTAVAASQLPPDTLAAITFGAPAALPVAPGARAQPPADPRLIRIPLEPLGSAAMVELWRSTGRVRTGSDGALRFAADEEHVAGVIELDEREHGGLAPTSELAYAAIRRFLAASGHPHLLRMWNYLGGINRGEGDAERYKQFCLGRAAGLGSHPPSRYPAATAIGRRDDSPRLQVYWLAARSAGLPLENPRQVSAYRYPRQYGPAAPSFSRAMLLPQPLLLISGTASILGHASRHPGSLVDQIDETLANLASVLERARAAQPALPRRWGAGTLFKVYLREPASAPAVAEHLSRRLPRGAQYLMLAADICRAELLVEIDCAHG